MVAERPEVSDLMALLAEPFAANEIRFKPAVVKDNRALALAYVDARVIQDRLDEVLGAEGWQDDYEALADGSVICRLKLRLGGEWITKVDVGGPSEQPDGGDRMKAAFSDALKRAAVKFGIGRFLYKMPQQWCDYDPQRRQFTKAPTIPPFARKSPPQEGANGHPQSAAAPAQAKATPAPQANSPCIDQEQAKHICNLLVEARLTKIVRFKDGKDHAVADCSGIFREYQITRLGELPLCHFTDAIQKIKRLDVSILPVAEAQGSTKL